MMDEDNQRRIKYHLAALKSLAQSIVIEVPFISDEEARDLDNRLDDMIAKIREVQHRLFCDDCRGDEGLARMKDMRDE